MLRMMAVTVTAQAAEMLDNLMKLLMSQMLELSTAIAGMFVMHSATVSQHIYYCKFVAIYDNIAA